ncbi:MAG: phenylalanine--tRNA ligase beta subunit-related protein [Bacteroidota bacterium]
MHLRLAPYPGLAVAAFRTVFPRDLAEVETPATVLAALALDADAPLQRDEAVRLAVRDLLRVHGYKPTGRGKPSPEYLIKAAEGGFLGPINAAVDCCNAVSLHSGLPISVVDLGLARAPFRVAPGGPENTYVFNASGHEIKVAGLLCLWDAEGPCANPVRDSQRTKTHEATRETLSVLYAPEGHTDRLAETAAWYRGSLEGTGAKTHLVETEPE